MTQPQVFDTVARAQMRARLQLYRELHGNRGTDWVADRIAATLPEAKVKSTSAKWLVNHRKQVQRFILNGTGGDDKLARWVAFIDTLPQLPAPKALNFGSVENGGAEMVTNEEPTSFKMWINTHSDFILFHHSEHLADLSWLEFDMDKSVLITVLSNGASRSFELPVHPDIGWYLRQAREALVIRLNIIDIPHSGLYVPVAKHYVLGEGYLFADERPGAVLSDPVAKRLIEEDGRRYVIEDERETYTTFGQLRNYGQDDDHWLC